MVIVVYDTRRKSGTTKNFAERLGRALNLEVKNVKDVKSHFEGDIILCTYTAGVGEVPLETRKFLNIHGKKVKAVISNGSSNFKERGLFALAGNRIANEFGCELVRKLDMGGSLKDVEIVAKRCDVILSLNTINLQSLKQEEKSTYINGVFNFKTI